jgi:hypothetical protein
MTTARLGAADMAPNVLTAGATDWIAARLRLVF